MRIQSLRSTVFSVSSASESRSLNLKADVPRLLADWDPRRGEIFVQNTGTGLIVVAPHIPVSSGDGIVVPPGGAFKDTSWKGTWWARSVADTTVTVVVTREWT